MRKIFLSAITITVLATACKKDDPIETNSTSNSNSSNFENNTELVNELKSYAPLAQIQTKNSDEVITFTTEKGNELIFPARAFVDGSGNPVTGNVDVSVTEITNVSEMILSGMMTNSNQGPLSSQGEFNVEVSQNGQPLELAEGSTFTIENKNAEVDKEMKGWTWQQKQTSGEAFENNVGEWVRNEFDENNPCDKMKSLWNAIENNSSNDPKNLWEVIKPLRDLIFTETNKINDLMDKKLAVHVADSPLNNAFISYNYNDFWICYKPQEDSAYDAIRGNGYNSYQFSDDSLEFQGISAWPEECAITFQSDNDSSIQTYSLNPNAINITFSQLSWCNIDKLLWEYGQINSCKLKGNFPDYAQVKIVFKDLNGALSCDFSDDGFVASRLPEGYDLMFLVYYKDGDSIKFGTQTITAAEEMTFNEENIKTLSNIDALVEEIEKLVD